MHEGIHIAFKAEELWRIAGIPVTNTMLMSWFVMIVLIVLAFRVGRSLVKIPGKLQTFFETLFSFLLDYIEDVLGSRALALRYLPLLATLFMFILLGNWFGLLPGIGSIYLDTNAVHAESMVHDAPDHSDPHGEEVAHGSSLVALFHPVSVDLNVTLALAIIAFLAIEISGVLMIGLFKYLGKFFNFHSPIGFFMGIIELISELARLISFSFRLFGNMFAGKTLILVAMFFLPYLMPVPLMLYEVLVGFIQAAIFAMLTLFFIKMAVSEAH